ncbi:MAG: SNF2-related protein [Thermoproteota archaeon]
MRCLNEELGSSLEIMYEGDGNIIAQRFYIPVLKRCISYDRLSGFFSADSLVVVAAGIAGLLRNNGRMRLVVGLHDVEPDLVEAYRISRERAEELMREIGERIAAGLERAEDIIARRRIEALAWMLVNGTLEVRVALPKKTFLGLGNGIFHEKLLIFRDRDGCVVAAAGSANETRAAYEVNGENLTVHMSWKPGHEEYIRRYSDRFSAIWEGKHPDYFVFPLPEAVERKLREKYYRSTPPEADPLEDDAIRVEMRIPRLSACQALVPAARLVKEMGNIRFFSHLGLGPVVLHPHQAYAVDFTLSMYPHRVLLADEVGLGKTIETGAIVKRLVSSGQVQRVLILSPKNVARQWMEEMWGHFGLRFWLFDSFRKAFVDAEDRIVSLEHGENPFDKQGIDLMIASWHYARGSRNRPPELLTAEKFFDLIIVDEAHHARKKRSPGKIEPTRLNELLAELSVTAPHIILVTATPVQLYEAEAMDLLQILGLGGPWVHEEDFQKYFQTLSSDPEAISKSEWLLCLRLASWIARQYVDRENLQTILKKLFNEQSMVETITERMLRGEGLERIIDMMLPQDVERLKQLLLVLSPVHWFMVRNTRNKLKDAGYRFPERDIKEEPVELDSKHRELLGKLDKYLRFEYGQYEKMVKGESKSVIGFVKCVYHQRFVSSLTAAYLTVRNRREFLEALLNGDREALLKAASRLLEEPEWEEDEEDIVEAMQELLVSAGAELIRREIQKLRELEKELGDYSPDVLSRGDLKLRKIVSVVDELLSRGHKVLVFSKYTDTVDAVSRFLARESRYLSQSEIAIYTGEGGRIYSKEKNSYIPVDKDDIGRELTYGNVRVLVCSDAAREGLNLQEASAVVNVDMPWNPAKVEQRIGRADRLGQKASVVLVRNIWYPDSIEAEMYRVLFQRREIYGLVIGPAQEIISEGLRRALDEGETTEKIRKIVSETLQKVEEVKEQAARIAGTLLGASWEGLKTGDEDVINRIAGFVLKATKALGLKARIEDSVLKIEDEQLPEELRRWSKISLEAGRPNVLTPAHPIVQWLCDSIISKTGGRGLKSPKSVYLVKEHDGLGTLRVIGEDESVPQTMDRDGVIQLLDELLSLGEKA